MPRIVVAGTAVLLASSLCLERARRLGSQVWLLATLALGCGFVAAQLLAWRQLAAMGLYFASTPHSSFFYLLTATHGAHLAGGMFALARVAAMADQRRARWLEISAIYWHFMGVLWLYLVYLLFGMR